MKKSIIILFGFLATGLAQAKDFPNEQGINFDVTGYPDSVTVSTTTSCSDLPLVCKFKNSMVNCSFNTSSNYICSRSVSGYVYFQTLDKKSYCRHELASSIKPSGKWTINVYSTTSNNMTCDSYPYSADGYPYRVNY